MQRKLDHPNICKILESFSDKRKSQVYIVMELCTGGSLVSRMKTHRHGYGEAAAATLVEKMLSATLYCHHHGIVHRDIKLDNMIYEDEREDAELKLIDFGFAQAVRPGHETMFDQLGTPSYMAPELWADRETPYDSSVDMWALGVVTYMLLSGQRPFHHSDKKEKSRMIREDPLRFPSQHWEHISQEAKDFCTALMQKRPKDRLPASEAVHHPWIKQASHIHHGVDASKMLEKHNEVVQALETFSEKDDLARLALEVIAFSTPPGKLEELRLLFQKMDTDDSGTINMAEFKDAMAKQNIPNDRIEQIFNSIDVSRNGEVDYTEFLAAAINSQENLVARSSIKAAFNSLDRDGDGYITREDIISSLGSHTTEASIKRYLLHSDDKGRVSYQIFKATMVSELASPQSAEAEEQLYRFSTARRRPEGGN